MRRYSILALLALLASLPLWLTPGLPNSDDSLTHVFNLLAFDRQLHAGQWFPLRFPDHGLAYGYAAPSYYPPLPYLLLELIRLAGAGYVLTFKLGFTLLIILAGWSSFALGRTLFGLRAGWVTAIVYLFSPYLLANAHLRGALAEQLGLVVGPLLFLALFQLLNRPGWPTFLGASGLVTLLLCSHFLAALLYLPFAMLYGLWLLVILGPDQRWARLGWMVAAALTGALLAAFYWLPAALEPEGRKAVDMATALAEYGAELFTLAQLLRPAALISYSNLHGMPELGLPLLILIGWAFVTGLAGGSRWSRVGRSQWLFFGLAALVALLLASTLAAQFWQNVPGVALLQFPFRWLGPAALFLALFIGAAAEVWPVGNRPSVIPFGLMLGGLLVWYGVASLWNLPRQPAMLRSLGVSAVTEDEINLAGLRAFEHDQADNLREQCWVWAYEYVPRPSALSDCVAMREMILTEPSVTAGLPPVQARLQPTQLTPNRLVANVSSPDPWRLSLHAFWIPGWRATVDGRPSTPQPLAPLGVVSIAVPAGEHTVQIEHGPTSFRQAARWLSALLVFLWLVLALRLRPAVATGVLTGLLLLIGPPLLVASQAASPPPLRDTQVEFAAQVALEGYSLEVKPGRVRLDLVWLAREEMDASYKVFVHLIDDTGRLWAQADSRPVQYASNTNRWPPGQLILDRHELALPAEMPAGQYQVRVGLYNEADGQRLPVVDAQGAPVDDQVLLELVTVETSMLPRVDR